MDVSLSLSSFLSLKTNQKVKSRLKKMNIKKKKERERERKGLTVAESNECIHGSFLGKIDQILYKEAWAQG